MGTTFINGVEFKEELSNPIEDTELLNTKIRKLQSRIKRGNNVSKKMMYAMGGILILLVVMLITIITQGVIISKNKTMLSELKGQFESIKSEYVTAVIDNANLKKELQELREDVLEMNEEDALEEIDKISTQFSSSALVGFTYNSTIPLNESLQRYAYAKCQEVGFSYPVFLGLMQKESTFNTQAKSKSGDYGLCQINKCNHKWMKSVFGETWDPMNGYDSIDASLFILTFYKDNYGYDNYHTLLMGYNMGPNNAKKCFDKGIYSSEYSRIIVEYAKNYGYTGNGEY